MTEDFIRKQAAGAWLIRYEEWSTQGKSVYDYHVSGHFMDGYMEGYDAGRMPLLAELEESARLHGMSGSREARHLAIIDDLDKALMAFREYVVSSTHATYFNMGKEYLAHESILKHPTLKWIDDLRERLDL